MAATTLDLLNQIISTSGYADRIPLATRENIQTVGNALNTLPGAKEMFITTIINKIAKTIINTATSANPFAKYKSENIPYGDTVEEIFINLIKGENFSGSAVDQFSQNKPDVKTLYHIVDRRLVYTITVSEPQLQSAFRNEGTLSLFIQGIIQTLYTSADHDEFVMGKKLLGSYGLVLDAQGAVGAVPTYKDAAKFQTVTKPTDLQSALDFFRTIKRASKNMSFVSKSYNMLGVDTSTPVANQVLFIRNDITDILDAELSGVYNLAKVVPNITVVEVDDFGDNAKRLGILVDSDIFRIFDQLVTTKTAENAKALYTNYFHHRWSLWSMSTGKNSISFDLA